MVDVAAPFTHWDRMEDAPGIAKLGQPPAHLLFTVGPDTPGSLVGMDANDSSYLCAHRRCPPSLEGFCPGRCSWSIASQILRGFQVRGRRHGGHGGGDVLGPGTPVEVPKLLPS